MIFQSTNNIIDQSENNNDNDNEPEVDKPMEYWNGTFVRMGSSDPLAIRAVAKALEYKHNQIEKVTGETQENQQTEQ